MASRHIATISVSGEVNGGHITCPKTIGKFSGDLRSSYSISLSDAFLSKAFKASGNKLKWPCPVFNLLHAFTRESFPDSHKKECGLDEGEFVLVIGNHSGGGRSGVLGVNKYEFPPPIDTTLFFGTLVLVRACVCKDNVLINNFSSDEWNRMYADLFGGFHDCEEGDDTDEENEDDEYDELPVTNEGYAKDGFVVDDEDIDEENEDDESNYDDDFSDDEFCMSDED